MNYNYRKHFHISKDDRFINKIKIKLKLMSYCNRKHFTFPKMIVLSSEKLIAYKLL